MSEKSHHILITEEILKINADRFDSGIYWFSNVPVYLDDNIFYMPVDLRDLSIGGNYHVNQVDSVQQLKSEFLRLTGKELKIK